MMGDKVARAAAGAIPFEVAVWSGMPVRQISILRNNEPVWTAEPNEREVELVWSDESPPRLDRLWYYVRVELDGSDGAPKQLAWTSPIWFFSEVPEPTRFPIDWVKPVPLEALDYDGGFPDEP